MSAPRNFFDVVVAGAGPGGLVTAALLAKRGYRVAVFPDDASTPTPLLVPGCRASPVLAWVFGQLGLSQELRNRLKRLDPGLQVVLPRHRIDVASQATPTRAELLRELGRNGDGALVDRWLAGVQAVRERTDALLAPPLVLPAESLRDSRAWRARLKAAGQESADLDRLALGGGAPEGHALRAVAADGVRYLSALHPADRPGPGPLRLFSLLDQGLWAMDGGRAAFLDIMRERLKTSGAALQAGGPVRAVEPSWRGEVRVETDREPIAARVLVHAGDARDLPGLLPPSGKRRRLEALVEGAREVARRRVLEVRARSEARPPGLGPMAVLDPADGAAPVLLETVEEADECLFSVVFEEPMRPDPAHGPPAERAFELLRWVAPFIDEHLLAPPAVGPGGAPVYEAPPAGLAPAGGAPDGGVSLLPFRTPYRQVFLAGHQVLPGLGIEGEFLAGVGCADLVARQVKRKDLLGR